MGDMNGVGAVRVLTTILLLILLAIVLSWLADLRKETTMDDQHNTPDPAATVSAETGQPVQMEGQDALPLGDPYEAKHQAEPTAAETVVVGESTTEDAPPVHEDTSPASDPAATDAPAVGWPRGDE